MVNELAVTDKPHRSDEPNLQDAEITRDDAGRVWPGYWGFVVSGSTWKFDKYETQNRKETGTEKSCTSWTCTQDLDPQ